MRPLDTYTQDRGLLTSTCSFSPYLMLSPVYMIKALNMFQSTAILCTFKRMVWFFWWPYQAVPVPFSCPRRIPLGVILVVEGCEVVGIMTSMMGEEKFLFKALKVQYRLSCAEIELDQRTSFMRTPCTLVVVSGGHSVDMYGLYTVLYVLADGCVPLWNWVKKPDGLLRYGHFGMRAYLRQ